MDPNATPDVQAPDPAQVAPPSQTPPDIGPPATATPTQAPPAQHASKWASVAEGALNALKGAGKGLVLGGLPGAVEGAVSPRTINTAWQRNQQMAQHQVDMAHAQSANLLAEAHLREQQAQMMGPEMQLRFKQNDEKLAQDYINRGISPVVVTHDDSPDAALQAAKQVLNDGTHVVVLRMGNGYAAFDLNALGAAPGALNDVNDMRMVRGNAPISAAQWNNKNMLSPGAKSQQMKDAATFYNPVPGKTMGEVDGQLTAYKNYLATAQKVPDAQFPNKEQRVEQLQTAVRMLQDQKQNLLNQQEKTVQNQMRVAKVRGASNSLFRVIETLGPNGAKKFSFAGDAVKNDGTPPSVWKDIEPLVKTGNDLEKTYQMTQDAVRDFKAGTKTGAQSMLLLANHLGSTFGAQKGTRQTKEMIAQHLGARSVSDEMEVAYNKLINGDELSANQWKAFSDLVAHSRRYSWGIATKEANAKKVDIRGLVPKDLGGSGDIRDPQANVQSQPMTSTAAPANSGPKVGTVEDGYRFKGGNASDPASWEKVTK